jgi:hypothetical protein
MLNFSAFSQGSAVLLSDGFNEVSGDESKFSEFQAF